MIYFDNSASTNYKPPAVINAVVNALTFLSANPGRGGHSMAVKAGRLVQAARETAAAFLGQADPGRVIFTDNCTGALNLAILGAGQKGGHVVTTALEHNSVLRPLHALKARGLITLTVVEPNGGGVVDADMIKRALTPRTYMVATNHVSNVTGAAAPIEEIGRLLKDTDILYLVDGAQSVGYVPVDIAAQHIDLLAVAPHKGLHAPQGVGMLLASRRAGLNPIRFGGTGTASHEPTQPRALPEGLETGTLPTPAIAGLNSAVHWAKRHFHQNETHILELSYRLLNELKNLPFVTVYTPPGHYNGIVSVNVGDLSSESVSDILSEEYDICTRAGLHCAPLVHRHYKTENRGMVRISLGCDNTFEQVEFLLKAIREIGS